MDGITFRAYVMQILVPTLAMGDIVMDILAAHKVTGVHDAINAVGAELHYLPPYSPDLNRIEQAFAKLKALLRKAVDRSIDALWRRIGDPLAACTLQECVNYRANAGYA